MEKIRIAAQVLNGATGEIREVAANVDAKTEQDAVNKLFARARRDDYYYRFLGHSGVIDPTSERTSMVHQTQTYWAPVMLKRYTLSCAHQILAFLCLLRAKNLI